MTLFDTSTGIIRAEADAILGSVDTLHKLAKPHSETGSLGAYDLRASAKNLREAADKLDEIDTRIRSVATA